MGLLFRYELHAWLLCTNIFMIQVSYFLFNSKNTFNFGRNYFFLTPLLDIQINHNNSTAMEKPPETNQRHRGENIIQHFV